MKNSRVSKYPLRAILLHASLAALLASAAGCGDAAPPAPENAEAPKAAVSGFELFLSRTSFSDTEFEHYKLSGENLFVECGTQRHGRMVPRQQTLKKASPQAAELMNSAAAEILSRLRSQKPSLESPGTNRSPADPGEFLLTFDSAEGSKSIRTSLDAAANDKVGFGRDLASFAELVRGSSNACGTQSFYGLGRKVSEAS